MTFVKFRITLLLAFLTSQVVAQVEDAFNGIRFQEDQATVIQKVKEIATDSYLVTVELPVFPLAQTREAHFIALGVTVDNGTVDQVSFSFADDKLVYIEAKGNAVSTIGKLGKGSPMNYLGFEVYRENLLLVDRTNDAVKLLTAAAAHPSLFMWQNPYFENPGARMHYNNSAKIPDFLKMGSNLEDLTPLLEANSSQVHRQELDGSDPNAQLQLNCFGIEYAGFPRKFEARFGDNKLNVVWILTAKQEEGRIRQRLTDAYGEALFVNEQWEAFNDWQVLLRKDVPEVLVLTKELAKSYKERLN